MAARLQVNTHTPYVCGFANQTVPYAQCATGVLYILGYWQNSPQNKFTVAYMMTLSQTALCILCALCLFLLLLIENNNNNFETEPVYHECAYI